MYKRRQKESSWEQQGIKGASLILYYRLLKSQNGKCGICGCSPDHGKMLALDHNHKTGVVRGLLCPRCNYALGGLEWLDSVPSGLTNARNHLKNTWALIDLPETEDEQWLTDIRPNVAKRRSKVVGIVMRTIIEHPDKKLNEIVKIVASMEHISQRTVRRYLIKTGIA